MPAQVLIKTGGTVSFYASGPPLDGFNNAFREDCAATMKGSATQPSRR
jgi:hypothetical protein